MVRKHMHTLGCICWQKYILVNKMIMCLGEKMALNKTKGGERERERERE